MNNDCCKSEHCHNVLCSNKDNLLTIYFNKIFLYGCKCKTVDFLKNNNIHPNANFSIKYGIINCFGNANGTSIISWIARETNIIPIAEDIAGICRLVSNYDSEVLNHLFKHIDANKTINELARIFYEQLVNIDVVKKLSKDIMNHLLDKINFNEIDEQRYHTVLYCFLIRGMKNIFSKYLSYPYQKEKKIKVLLNLLSLFNHDPIDINKINLVASTINLIANSK